MKVIFPSYHYDAISEFSFIFRKLGWEVGLLSAEAFNIFGMERAMSDPDGFDRMNYQASIAEDLQAQHCTELEHIADADIILVNSASDKQKWENFAKKKGLSPVVVSVQLFLPLDANTQHLLTPDIVVYNSAPSDINKMYWNGIFGDVATDYKFIGSSHDDHGIYSYVNRMPKLYPNCYYLASTASNVYKKISGKHEIKFFGQDCPDGSLHGGRYGQKDEVLEVMRSSLATLHIKPIDRPGMVILRTMLLGKPLIIWDKLLKDSQMCHLLNDTTCYPVSDAEDIVRTMLALESGADDRQRAVNGARLAREICSWEQIKPRFLAFLDRVLDSLPEKKIPAAHQKELDTVGPSVFSGAHKAYHSFTPLINNILTRADGPLSVVEWGPGANTELFLASPKVTRVVSYESDLTWFKTYRERFSAHRERLDLQHKAFDVSKPVTAEITAESYDLKHPYITDVLERFGENSFDIAFVDGGGYRTDCAEIAQALVKDGGYIIWHDIVSWRENNPEFPSGRTYQSVFCRFPEYYYHDDLQTLLVVNRKNSTAYTDDKKLQAKAALLKIIFDNLLHAGVRYVVLRNAGDIPLRCSIDNDIDLAVHPEDMSVAHKILIECLPQHSKDAQSKESLLYGAKPHDHYKLPQLDLHIDVVQGLYYTSPNNSEKVAIATALQESLFNRRRFVYDLWHFIPHEIDTFIHILAHALFDKTTISPFYKMQLEFMVGFLDKEQLKSELSLILYSFAGKAIDLICAGRTEELHQEYKSFVGY